MIRSALAAIVLLGALGCSPPDEEAPRPTMKPQHRCICIDGVEYIHVSGLYHGYLVPHFKPDGTLFTCQKQVAEGRRG